MKKFRRGLVVGKFAPLHLGHDLVLRQAGDECQELVILSYTRPEFPEFPPPLRESWLRELYPSARVIVLDSESDPQVPENSASDETHRHFVADLYIDQVGEPLDAIFTSESYGDGFTERMSERLRAAQIQSHAVTHVSVDPARARIPISGTALRASIHDQRAFLPRLVYASLVKSVCFLGAESTGKSTLSEMLARRLNTSFTDEYGRTLWVEKQGSLEFEDYLLIAREQIKKENEARANAHQYFFADTSPLTTLFYSEEYCGRSDPQLVELSYRAYDYVFLNQPDFPLVQDGTRAGDEFRNRQHEWYVRTLAMRGISYVSLSGGLEERVERVLEVLGRR